MAPSEDTPDVEAEVVLVRTDQVNLWRVLRCPYCGKPHTHGAGKPTDDPISLLGYRVAHCISPGPHGEYRLVLQSDTPQ